MISIGHLQEDEFAIIIQKEMCQIYHPEKGFIAKVNIAGNHIIPPHTKTQLIDETCLTSTMKRHNMAVELLISTVKFWWIESFVAKVKNK